jgi:DNA polymerase-3 subunit delta
VKADAARVRAALAAPSPDIRFVLLHGPDEAGARSLADGLASAMGPDAERVDLAPAALKSNPGLLADEAASMSLFGSARHIRIAGAGEEVLEALTLLLAAEHAGNPVVVLAPSLRTTAKVVKLALDSRRALAHACYEPNAAEAERLVIDLARREGLQPDRGVARRPPRRSGGDRAVMAREVEKLALFLDAAPDRPKPLDDAAVDAIGADLVDADSDVFAAAVTGGRVAVAGDLLTQLAESGQSAVPWLRALVRRLITLAELRRESAGGGDLGAALKRHRIHFSQEAEMRAAVSRWTPDRIAAAMDAIRRAERAMMGSATAGDVLARSAALDVARQAASR